MEHISFYPERWTFAEYFAFSRSLISGQLENCYALVEKIISAEDFQSLNAESGARLLNRISIRLSQDIVSVAKPDPETNVAPVDSVSVSLSKWSIPQISEFERVNKLGDVPNIERLMHIVAKIEGVSSEVPLPYWEGLLMKTAVMAKHNRILSGKN